METLKGKQFKYRMNEGEYEEDGHIPVMFHVFLYGFLKLACWIETLGMKKVIEIIPF